MHAAGDEFYERKMGSAGEALINRSFHTSSQLVGACSEARLIQKMDSGLAGSESMRQRREK